MKKNQLFEAEGLTPGFLMKIFRIMKISVFLLFIGILQVFADDSYSQTARLTMSLSNATVEQVLDEIEAQSEFYILYNHQLVDVNRRVDIEVSDKQITTVLSDLFVDTDINYLVSGRQIILSPRDFLYETVAEIKSTQESIEIKGIVTDENGESLPGATVMVKGTRTGTITDVEGNYTLAVQSADAILIFSYVGMKSQEVSVANQITINIVLELDVASLDEVVVTALGIKREKASLGYAASKVEGVEVERSAAPNLANALSGKAAGVFITNPNSIEGGSSRITLRGNTSLAGGNQPLIIVDGMPFANVSGATSTTSNRDYGSALNQIEAMDIESIDILKGTAASALYGSRGANGVILITTKKGDGSSGMTVEYTLNMKVTTPYRYQDFQNEYGYGGPGGANGALWKIPELGTKHPDIWGDGYGIVPSILPNGSNYNSWSYDQFSWYGTNSSWGPKLDGTMITWWDGEERAWSPQPDNMSLFYNNGSTITNNLSISSNSEIGSIRASITHKNNDAIIVNSGFKSTNLYIGGNINLGKRLKAEVFTNYNRRDLTNPPLLGQTNNSFTNLFYNLPRSYKALEWTDYKNPDGSRNNQNGWGYWISKNIGWDFHENEYKQYLNQMRSYIKLMLDPTDWLSLSGSAGLDFTSDEREKKNGFTDGIGLVGGAYNHSLGRTFATNFDFLATLHKADLFDGFDASLSFGGEAWHTNMYSINGNINRTAKSPYIYSFANYETDPTASQARPGEGRYEKQINSLFGLLNLSYKDFIYLQVTARNDWSSTLPKENNNYFYPGASISFVPSELWDMGSAISFGKFRFAYAETGSDTRPYQVTPTFTPGSFGGKPTVSMEDGLPNLGLQSQRSKEIEIGTNWAFFKSKLNVDFTYYNKHSYDQILSAPLPWSSGSNSIKFNTGELELKGLEFNINVTVLSKRDLRWDIGILGSKFSNTLLSLTEGVDVYNIGGLWGAFGTTMRATTGQNFGAIYGWGIEKSPDGRPILNALKDVNGNVTSTLYKKTAEQVIVGNATPKLIGGINSTFSWKNFTVFALIDFKMGGDIYCPQYGSALIGGLSPATLDERNGGGLPYTYPSGETANIGVILDGVIEIKDEEGNVTGYQENTNVVHAYYKYAGNGWNPNPQPQAIFENSWVKFRELTLSYRLPPSLFNNVNWLQNIDLSLIGRDLFYIYDTMPDNINPEGINGVGDAQYVIAGALPGARSFAFNLKVSF
ncbi:MAG: SusC/RagA family TonB-linked outer membrane protein [Bacteroidales bacterium]|nr:SusC/RagA family TonB-linked outer membrane protein [Bacteroidales bacterium]